MSRAELTNGWLAVPPSQHRHFYRDGVKLCAPGELVSHGDGDRDHNHPGNCYECLKSLHLFSPRHTEDGAAGRHLIGRFR